MESTPITITEAITRARSFLDLVDVKGKQNMSYMLSAIDLLDKTLDFLKKPIEEPHIDIQPAEGDSNERTAD